MIAIQCMYEYAFIAVGDQDFYRISRSVGDPDRLHQTEFRGKSNSLTAGYIYLLETNRCKREMLLMTSQLNRKIDFLHRKDKIACITNFERLLF